MGTDRSADRYQGLLIPDARISVDNIVSESDPTVPSSFTQAGPVPGVPKPEGSTDLVLQASGAMDEKKLLEVYTQRPGHAGRNGAGFLWRDVSAGDSEAQRFGWDPYSVFVGWEVLLADKTHVNTAWPSVLRLANGKLVATGTQTPNNSGQFQVFYIYDPTSGTWDIKSLSLPSARVQGGASVVELPGGRLLWFGTAWNDTQVEVRYSDDEFTSWSAASPRALKTACSGHILKITAAYSAGEVGLWVLWDNGGTYTISQYASDDLGLRFTRVVDDWNAEVDSTTPSSPIAIAADAGGFLLGLVKRDVNSHSVVWSVASAFVVPSVADQVTVNSNLTSPFGSDSPLALWRDESGAVFVMGHSDGHASSPNGECAIFVSYDDGRSFSAYTSAEGLDVHSTGADPSFRKYAVASTSGRSVMITRWAGDDVAYDPGSLAAVYLGGYGRHTAPLSDSATEFTDADAIGFSSQLGGSGEGFVWCAVELPEHAGWTKAGAGTYTEADEARAGALLPAKSMVLSSNSSAAEVNWSKTISADHQVFAQFAVTVPSGSGDQSADDVVVKVRISGGGDSYEARYRFDSSGWTIVDPSGPTDKGSVSADVSDSSSLMLHRVAISLPEEDGPISFRTWYARHGHALAWAEGPSGTLGDQTSPTNSGLEFGHFNGVQGDSANWHHLSVCGWGSAWSPTHQAGIGESWSSPDDLHPRNVPALGLPALLDGNTKIAAVDGPTVRGEVWNIESAYSYPIDHAIASQGPRVHWSSKDEAEQLIVWDLHSSAAATESRLLNSSIGCALLGCNFRRANLQYWDGAAWVTLIALDAATGFTSLGYVLDGNVVTVSTESAAGRYLNYDDTRAATWIETGGKARTILTQTEGAWSPSTTKKPRLLLAGADGSESASGTCELWFSDMCGLAHEVTVTPRYIRLQIPASQGTVANRYQIGQILIGSLLVFGHQPSRGFTTSTSSGVAVADLADGSSVATRVGPPRRSLELSWDDGVDASQQQASSPSPDYVAATAGGLPVATRSDIARTLEGAMRRAASGDSPVVYIGRIPTSTATPATLNNPRQFLYGRAGAEYRREHITGDESVSEVDRIAKITITEVV